MLDRKKHGQDVQEQMATMRSDAKKARTFFPFRINVCKPGGGQLVGGETNYYLCVDSKSHEMIKRAKQNPVSLYEWTEHLVTTYKKPRDKTYIQESI